MGKSNRKIISGTTSETSRSFEVNCGLLYVLKSKKKLKIIIEGNDYSDITFLNQKNNLIAIGEVKYRTDRVQWTENSLFFSGKKASKLGPLLQLWNRYVSNDNITKNTKFIFFTDKKIKRELLINKYDHYKLDVSKINISILLEEINKRNNLIPKIYETKLKIFNKENLIVLLEKVQINIWNAIDIERNIIREIEIEYSKIIDLDILNKLYRRVMKCQRGEIFDLDYFINNLDQKISSKIYSSACKPINEITKEEIMKLRAKKNSYRDYYYSRDVDIKFKNLIEKEKNVLIVGPPLAGKTRLVYQWIMNQKNYLVIIPHYQNIDKPNFSIPTSNDKYKKKILFLDDLQRYITFEHFNYLLRKFLQKEDILVIAICQSEIEYSNVVTVLNKEQIIIENHFTKLMIKRIEDNEGKNILSEIGEKTWVEVKDSFDHTIGSLFLPLAKMKERYKKCTPIQKVLLKTIKIANTATMYKGLTGYPINWIKSLAVGIYEVNIPNYEFISELKTLELNEFFIIEKDYLLLEEVYLNTVIEPEWKIDLLEMTPKIIISMENNPAALFLLANQLLILGITTIVEKKNNIEVAIKVYDAVIKGWKELISQNYLSEFSTIMLGMAYNNRGISNSIMDNLEKALEDLNKVIELKQDYIEAYKNRGNIYTKLGKNNRALKDYNKVIDLNPNDEQAFYSRGITYVKLKDYVKALDDFNKAIELNFSNEEVFYNRGITHNKLNKFKKALEDYNKAIELKPDYVEAYNNRGNIYKKQGDFNKALDDFNKIIELKPNDEQAFYNRGITHNKLNKFKKALEDYNKAIELKPDYVEAYYNRGNIYTNKFVLKKSLDDFNKALEDFNKAIELKPDFAYAYSNRGLIYLNLDKNKKALKDYNKALELNPKIAEAYNNRGTIYIKQEDFNKALDDFNKAIELKPDYAIAYNFRGTTNEKLGNDIKALNDFNTTISLNSNFIMAYNNRGGILMKLEKYDEALNDFNIAIELNPKIAEIYYNRGSNHEKLGNYSSASSDFMRSGIILYLKSNSSFSTECFEKGYKIGVIHDVINNSVLYCSIIYYLLISSNYANNSQLNEVLSKILKYSRSNQPLDPILLQLASLTSLTNEKLEKIEIQINSLSLSQWYDDLKILVLCLKKELFSN